MKNQPTKLAIIADTILAGVFVAVLSGGIIFLGMAV